MANRREQTAGMEASPPKESSLRISRRVPKPLMEKRRRDRINSNLEALRLLMLENTDNEKLKNPKVEKAEILESVVDFLQEKGHQARPARARHPRYQYQDGVNSCLRRVCEFVTCKNQDAKQNSAPHRVACSMLDHQPPANPPGFMHPNGSAPLPLQQLHHPYLYAPMLPAAPMHLTDAVWRPWPQ